MRGSNCLLPLMGPACQKLFETFSDTGTDFATAIDKFDEHFKTTKNVPYERHKFNQCKQKPKESIDQFIVRLRTLAATCDFQGEKDNMIRDVVIAKTTSDKFRKRLLMEPDLTLEKVLKLGRLIESADQ